MKHECHALLGRFLVRNYLEESTRLQTRAFLIGCVQPDKNPATYLKGSIRSQWLRGHNWDNANRYIQRIAKRLEKKDRLRLPDYYRLGKLIHYVTDAFTYAHNADFPRDLKLHRSYEWKLLDCFRDYLRELPALPCFQGQTVMETIHENHRHYLTAGGDIHTDSQFSITVCCCILGMLV